MDGLPVCPREPVAELLEWVNRTAARVATEARLLVATRVGDRTAHTRVGWGVG